MHVTPLTRDIHLVQLHRCRGYVLTGTSRVELRRFEVAVVERLATTRWGIITGPRSAKWHNFVTVLFFCINIPTTKHEIMLHAMSLKGGSRTSTNCVHVSWQLGTNRISALLMRQSGSGACVFLRVLKWKADTSNTNWASSLECCCCL